MFVVTNRLPFYCCVDANPEAKEHDPQITKLTQKFQFIATRTVEKPAVKSSTYYASSGSDVSGSAAAVDISDNLRAGGGNNRTSLRRGNSTETEPKPKTSTMDSNWASLTDSADLMTVSRRDLSDCHRGGASGPSEEDENVPEYKPKRDKKLSDRFKKWQEDESRFYESFEYKPGSSLESLTSPRDQLGAGTDGEGLQRKDDVEAEKPSQCTDDSNEVFSKPDSGKEAETINLVNLSAPDDSKPVKSGSSKPVSAGFDDDGSKLVEIGSAEPVETGFTKLVERDDFEIMPIVEGLEFGDDYQAPNERSSLFGSDVELLHWWQQSYDKEAIMDQREFGDAGHHLPTVESKDSDVSASNYSWRDSQAEVDHPGGVEDVTLKSRELEKMESKLKEMKEESGKEGRKDFTEKDVQAESEIITEAIESKLNEDKETGSKSTAKQPADFGCGPSTEPDTPLTVEISPRSELDEAVGGLVETDPLIPTDNQTPTADMHDLSIHPHIIAYGDQLRMMQQDAEELRQEMDTTVNTRELETTDEIVVETKVTEVKTVTMLLSETGDIAVTEMTEVKTDTDMKETRKVLERDEVIMSHRSLDKKPTEDSPTFIPLSPTGPPSPAYSGRSKTSDNAPPSNTASEEVSEQPESLSKEADRPELKLMVGAESLAGLYVAISPYEPESDEVMSLHEGEFLEVLEDQADDWWLVKKSFDGREGYVPAQYLRDKDQDDQMIEKEVAKQAEEMSPESSRETPFGLFYLFFLS